MPSATNQPSASRPLLASAIPLPRADRARGDADARPRAGRDAGEGKIKPLALVVDDAPDVTEMLGMLMRFAGYEVVTAFGAAEAFDAARRSHFDVVISDIGMPGMNGYELAEALRGLPSYAAVPLIAVTGFAMYDDRDKAIEAGFNTHLSKPIDPLALTKALSGIWH